MPKNIKTEEGLIERRNSKKIGQDFVPLDESDIAHSVEILEKNKPGVSVIKKSRAKKNYSGKTLKKNITKKVATNKITTKKWVSDFSIPGPKKLKENGFVMIITEKPQAAEKIASALAEKNLTKKNYKGVSYYELKKNNQDIRVVCAVGHLFTLAQVNTGSSWPDFDIKWAPNFLIRKKDFTKKYYDLIAKFSKESSKIIVATDYDVEGEVIGMNIVKHLCNQPDAERMKFSTLTSKEIKTAFDNRSKNLDWNQGIAGETRHYIDWIYGINLSRALMESIKTTGSFRIISIGRVQGPSLNLIVKKEKEIEKFKPQKYWQSRILISDGKNKAELKHIKDITKPTELDFFKNLEGKEALASTEKSKKNVLPPAPFDLTTLQTESYKHFGLTPSKTLEIAQRLYLAGVISYPRTSSQKIPKEIGYEEILEKLKLKFSFAKKGSRKIPIEGKKSDPAHPSIYPTGEFQVLNEDEEKIFMLIVKRFVSCFCDDLKMDNKKIQALIEDKKFSASGVAVTSAGWTAVYPYKIEEITLPDMNGQVNVEKSFIDEKMTQPPNRYSPASILSILEKKNLGTKATRASILETLYDRDYIKEKSIQATSLGMALIETLEKNCPIIIDEKLTFDMENELEHIRKSKNPLAEKEKILAKTKEIIIKVSELFQKNKGEVGKDLIQAINTLWAQQKKDSEVCQCPTCKTGTLAIKFNKNSSRYFLACNAYPKCRQTFSLPPNSFIKKSDKLCSECGYPLMISLRKGKKPWIFCFNPECKSKNKED
jgi:DNA topoisomerase I